MLELAGKKIPNTLAEIVHPERTALLVWDMEYAIAPNAFNYQEILANLQALTGVARQMNVPVFYAQQTPFDLEKEEAGAWVRVERSESRDLGLRVFVGKQQAVVSSSDIATETLPELEVFVVDEDGHLHAEHDELPTALDIIRMVRDAAREMHNRAKADRAMAVANRPGPSMVQSDGKAPATT